MDKKLSGMRLFLGRLLFFIKPMTFTGVFYASWFVTRSWMSRYISFTDSQSTSGQIEFIGVFHAMIAAWVYGRATSDRSKLYELYAREDWVGFVIVRDDRIPWYTHWLMSTFSLSLAVGAFVIRHEMLAAGSFTTITIGLIISAYWQAAIMADDPLDPRWCRYDNLKPIPDEYKRMTLDEAREKMREKAAKGESHIYAPAPPPGYAMP